MCRLPNPLVRAAIARAAPSDAAPRSVRHPLPSQALQLRRPGAESVRPLAVASVTAAKVPTPEALGLRHRKVAAATLLAPERYRPQAAGGS